MGVTVRGPDGRVWKVRRRLEWPRLEPVSGDAGVPLDATADDLPFATAVLVVVVLVLATLLIVPLVVFFLEAVLAVIAVIVARRPWRVEAVTDGPPAETRVRRVRGWRASRRAVRDVARELAENTT